MKTQRSALWKGEVESVVQALEALTPKSEEATEFVRQSIGYFQTNRERMRYDRFRDRGYPIGSGAVEGGGCKCLVGGRGCAGASGELTPCWRCGFVQQPVGRRLGLLGPPGRITRLKSGVLPFRPHALRIRASCATLASL